MFNHSKISQNVGWERNLDARTITYKALRDIEVGEELCVSYGSKLWFTDSEGNNEVKGGNEGEAEDRDGVETINQIEWP